MERWAEDSGNAALMGRELPPAEVLAADPADHRLAPELKQARAATARHGRAPRRAYLACSSASQPAQTPAARTARDQIRSGSAAVRLARPAGARRRRGLGVWYQVRGGRPDRADGRLAGPRPAQRGPHGPMTRIPVSASDCLPDRHQPILVVQAHEHSTIPAGSLTYVRPPTHGSDQLIVEQAVHRTDQLSDLLLRASLGARQHLAPPVIDHVVTTLLPRAHDSIVSVSANRIGRVSQSSPPR